jgi:hypothetical protein
LRGKPDLGGSHDGDLFGRREPPRGACGAAWHLRSSSILGEGPDSSRCRIPAPSTTAFNRDSFHPLRTGAARRSLGIHRRPPTSRAHRLGKPDRASELLTFYVARWPLKGGLLTHAFVFHRARSAVAAVGLGRRRPADQNAFHRFDSSLAARAGKAALVVHVRCLAPHPVARREPWSASSKAGGSPRATSCGHEPSCDGDVTSRERCVSPTSATESLHEHSTDCSIPGRTSCRAPSCDGHEPGAPTHRGPEDRGLPLTVTLGSRRAGSPSSRLSDEPTRWSFA